MANAVKIGRAILETSHPYSSTLSILPTMTGEAPVFSMKPANLTLSVRNFSQSCPSNYADKVVFAVRISASARIKEEESLAAFVTWVAVGDEFRLGAGKDDILLPLNKDIFLFRAITVLIF